MTKPSGRLHYGSIGHLPGSRLDHNHTKYATGKVAGKDICVDAATAAVCTVKARKGDRVIVQEKLDGSNVAIANIDGTLVTLGRSGRPAISSPHEQHRLFAQWVIENAGLFAFLQPGERLCGEWLAMAHGTRYALPHAPFVAFDLIRDCDRRRTPDDPTGCRIPRLTHDEFMRRCAHLPTPHVVSDGPACSIERALSLLDPKHHGALEPIEGCVWRVERDGWVQILAKYVRPDKIDGKYFPEISGQPPVWNWRSS